MKSLKTRQRGVTLVELMVVLAILAILIGLAYPSYQAHVLESRRADAYTALLTTAQRLEQCFTEFSAYNDGDCPVTLPAASAEGFYRVTGALTATTFTLTATPKGSQSDDTCTALTYDNIGLKGATGGSVDECW